MEYLLMDSQKHASILEGVLDALKGRPSPNSSQQNVLDRFVDPVAAKREMENHKGLTKSMQAHLAREMSKTKDETILALNGHPAEDERRHNEILETIARKCDRMIR